MNSKYENTDMKMQPKKQRNLTGFFNLLSIAGLAGCALLAILAYKNGILNSVDSVQVIIPILPGGVSCLGGVIFFGPWLGFLYNYIGICIGSIAVFGISKTIGRPVLYKMFSEKMIEKYDGWTQKDGKFLKLFALAIFIYRGGFPIVEKSGVGKAIEHQEKMLNAVEAPRAARWKEATVVHMNTVFPDSVIAAFIAKMQKKKVIYYGHSTMEDFKNSFIGSNLAAPIFKKWICFCYNLGDVVVTPTEYSRKLLEGYGLKRKIYSITNGVDTEFFKPDPEGRIRFRAKYQLTEEQKVVISVGHLIERKGILDFLELARMMPKVQFIWFGGGNESLVTAEIKEAISKKPDNVLFAGFVKSDELRDAYCGADVFSFMSYEETEGIVVLEALACEIPTIVRNIPVYEGWLEDEKQVYKAETIKEFQEKITAIFSRDVRLMKKEERKIACNKSLGKVGERLLRLYSEME